MTLIRDLLLFPPGAPVFRLTATTTLSPQTVTIQRLTPTGASTTINWGDGSALEVIAAGFAGAIPHVYAIAGIYPITVANPTIVTYLDLRDAKLSCLAGQICKLTSLTALALIGVVGITVGVGEIGTLTRLTYMNLQSSLGITIGAGEIGGLVNLTSLTIVLISAATIIGAGEIGLLTNLTTLALISVTGITVGAGEIGLLTNLTTLYLSTLPGITIGAGEIGLLTNLTALNLITVVNVTPGAAEFQNLIAIRTIQYENNLIQAAVDAVLQNIWIAKATYTWATPSLDLLGGGNAAPSGVYASVCPPTTGKEWHFDLVNGICTPAGPEWTVVTA